MNKAEIMTLADGYAIAVAQVPHNPRPLAKKLAEQRIEKARSALETALQQQPEPAKYTEAKLLAYGRAEFARALLLAARTTRPYGLAGETMALRILQIDGIFEDNARKAKP